FLNRDTAGDWMMDGVPEFFLQRAGMFGRDARGQDGLTVRQKFRGDTDDLFRSFARTKSDFGEIFPERAVHVHLRKAEVGHRRGLEEVQNLFTRDFPGAKILEQLRGFGICHRGTMPQELPPVTLELPSPNHFIPSPAACSARQSGLLSAP